MRPLCHTERWAGPEDRAGGGAPACPHADSVGPEETGYLASLTCCFVPEAASPLVPVSGVSLWAPSRGATTVRGA